jgi:hypothetical protein
MNAGVFVDAENVDRAKCDAVLEHLHNCGIRVIVQRAYWDFNHPNPRVQEWRKNHNPFEPVSASRVTSGKS